MIQNTVQTLIDYIKDITGQSDLPTERMIRALNFGTDHLSVIKLMAGGTVNPDSSNHSDLPRATVTTSSATLSVTGGTLDEGELNTLRMLEVLVGSEYKRMSTIDSRSHDYEYLQSTVGTPEHFDIDGNVIRLFPVPNASYTYRLTYGRVHPRYSADNLTQATGLLPNEEEYVALYASDRVMIGVSDASRTAVRNEMTVKQAEIVKMVGLKDQSTSKRIKPNRATFTRNSFKR